jgi:hypothetical protein
MNNSLGKTQGVVSAEQPIEGLGPQGGESLIAQLDSPVTQAEQLRDQQVQQQSGSNKLNFVFRNEYFEPLWGKTRSAESSWKTIVLLNRINLGPGAVGSQAASGRVTS